MDIEFVFSAIFELQATYHRTNVTDIAFTSSGGSGLAKSADKSTTYGKEENKVLVKTTREI